MVDAVRVGSAVGVVVGGMLGEREMFARACWKILVLQGKSRQAGVRSFLTGDGARACRGGELHNFLLLALLDRFARRADFGFVWSRG